MLDVVAAVIHDPAGRILIARRPLHKHQGGLWEFPGGKVDAGESAAQALVRELREELGIEATVFRLLLTVEHHYPDKSVRLTVFRVTAFTGQAHGAEGQPIAWVAPEALAEYEFPAANAPILRAAVLPDRYFITPDPSEVDGDVLAWLSARIEPGMWLVLRAKSLSVAAYAKLAEQVGSLCQARGAHLLLHTRVDLLEKVPATIGVHLSASSLAKLSERGGVGNRYLAVSAHSAEELEQAWAAGADLATLSPVLPTRSHPGQPGMSWDSFATLTAQAKLPVYALGGMTPALLATAHRHGAQGIAGIGLLVG